MEGNNKSWLSFLTTKTFFKNLSYSLGFGVLILLSVLVVLRFYTRHDNLIELPNFNGLDIKVVDSNIEESVKINVASLPLSHKHFFSYNSSLNAF